MTNERERFLKRVVRELDDFLNTISRLYRIASSCFKVSRRVSLGIRRVNLHRMLKKSVSQNAYEETISIGDKIIDIVPNDYNALLQKGIALCRCDFYEEGIITLMRAAQINPRDATVFLEIGKAYSTIGVEQLKAIKYYNRALFYCQNNGEKIDILTLRGNENMKIQRYREACNDYIQVVSIDWRKYAVSTKLGECFYSIGLYDNALRAYQKALDSNFHYDPAVYGKLLSLTRLGNFDETLRLCKEHLSANPQSHKYTLLTAHIYFLRQHYDDAIDMCDRLLIKDQEENCSSALPSYQLKALLIKGNALARLGKHGESTSVYQKVIEGKDDFCKYKALVANAESLEYQGRFGEALEYYHHALAINCTDPLIVARYYRTKDIVTAYSAYVAERSKSLFSMSIGPICLKIG